MDESVVMTEPRWTVTLPSLDDVLEVNTLIIYLGDNTDKRGVKKLLGQLIKRRMHQELVASYTEDAVKTTHFINHGRAKSTTKSGLKRTATKFYESLNTPGLRSQCTLFNVDYDSYEDQESIIAALVEKHVEMAR
jgi:hypothetical protein